MLNISRDWFRILQHILFCSQRPFCGGLNLRMVWLINDHGKISRSKAVKPIFLIFFFAALSGSFGMVIEIGFCFERTFKVFRAIPEGDEDMQEFRRQTKALMSCLITLQLRFILMTKFL